MEHEQRLQLYMSLCPANNVWVNRNGYGNIDVFAVNNTHDDKSSINLNKVSFDYNMLTRLGPRVSNSRNKDSAWRPQK